MGNEAYEKKPPPAKRGLLSGLSGKSKTKWALTP
jgi:hypothetical protein